LLALKDGLSTPLEFVHQLLIFVLLGVIMEYVLLATKDMI
jgi:hypothetical protein